MIELPLALLISALFAGVCVFIYFCIKAVLVLIIIIITNIAKGLFIILMNIWQLLGKARLRHAVPYLSVVNELEEGR